jgi:hypothetical protein
MLLAKAAVIPPGARDIQTGTMDRDSGSPSAKNGWEHIAGILEEAHHR